MSKASSSSTVNVCDHPVLLHKLAHLREVHQPPREFRRLMHDLTLLVGYEATRGLSSKPVKVHTPMCETTGQHLTPNVAIVPILRAGLGMSEAMLELLPNASVHHIGMYRLKGSTKPVEYYNRLPRDRVADVSFVLDPLVASGNTLDATICQLKQWGSKKIVVVSLIATVEGLAFLTKEHPDVELFVVSGDDTLDPDGRVLPGLGDAGDRQFFMDQDMENPWGITLEGGDGQLRKKRTCSIDDKDPSQGSAAKKASGRNK
mmetsp:Transcript_4750/g.11160  ORF Transcript_4750/g.11160 Transcript_4750/m.11160 type:complete len:260 (-) Transcript_4750:379-1158(-)